MDNLWTVRHIADYLGFAQSTIYSRIICRPDFPQPVRFGGHPRWFPDEVRQWCRRQRRDGAQSPPQ